MISVSVVHLRHIPALTEHHLHILEISSISLDCHLYSQYLLPPCSLRTVREESEPHTKSDLVQTHLSEALLRKVLSVSAILTTVVCCTWALYRPHMVFFFLFVLLLNCVLPGTIENHV